MIWGRKLIGQFQTEEEILGSPIQDNEGNRTLRPGDFKYEDLNKDGIIDGLDDYPVAHGTTPDVNFGLNINLAWKGFDLNILLQGATNFNMMYTEGQMAGPLIWGRNTYTIYLDRWRHEDIFDPTSPWIPGKYPSTGAVYPYVPSNSWWSSFWLPDASYVRLKSIELGYSIENSLVRKIGIRNLRIYLSGFNLFTWTKLQYMDPELTPELWGNNDHPIMKNVNAGLNITF